MDNEAAPRCLSRGRFCFCLIGKRVSCSACASPNIVYLHSHDTGRYVQPYGLGVETPNIQCFSEGASPVSTGVLARANLLGVTIRPAHRAMASRERNDRAGASRVHTEGSEPYADAPPESAWVSNGAGRGAAHYGMGQSGAGRLEDLTSPSSQPGIRGKGGGEISALEA